MAIKMTMIFLQILLAIFPILVSTSESPRDILSVDIFEEQPVGSLVTDIAQELGLSVDKSASFAAAFYASNFKIVVANLAINEYFGISPTNGRITLKKHLDRDTLCQNERLCCDSEVDRGSTPIQLPDGSYFRRTAKTCKLSFRVVYQLSENGSALHESRMAFCSTEVTIHDLNDCAPRFLLKDNFPTYGGLYRPMQKSISITIPESTGTDACFDLPMAFDEDSGQYGIQEYRIESTGKGDSAISGNIHDLFAVRLESCEGSRNPTYDGAGEPDIANMKPKLQLRQKLDREAVAEYHLTLVAVDGVNSGGPASLYNKHTNLLPHSASLTVTILVGDVNDHVPEVDHTVEVKLKEDIPVGTRVTQIIAHDKDIGDNGKIRYEIRPIGPVKISRFPFAIDSTSGIISIVNPLDADSLPPESHGVMEFLVISSDNGQDVSYSSTTTVSAHIEDINDEAPVIKTVDLASRSNPPRPSVQENLPPGTLVAFVTVTDADSGSNGMVTCKVDNVKFDLESIGDKGAKIKELQLVTKVVLDREDSPLHRVTIICVDHAHPVTFAKTGIQRILVTVTDENDNDPMFHSDMIEITVPENNPPGELLYRLNATDADEQVSWNTGLRTPLIYEIDQTGQRYFNLDQSSGNLYTKESFDREKQELIKFGVVVKDHGIPQRSASAKVMVRILDRNDHAPEFEQKEYNISVLENIAVGEVILKVIAHDKDQGQSAEFTYHMDDLRGSAQKRFELDPISGNLSVKSELDRETESQYSFQIYSIDKGSPRQTAYCRVNIQVLDVNDNSPKFVYPTQMNHTIHFSSWNSPGSPLLKLTAVDIDAGVNAEKIFLIAEGNEKGIFQLDIQTGDLSLKPGLDPLKVAGRYNLKLEVRDDGSPSLSGFTYVTVILDAARPPPSSSVLSPGKMAVDHAPLKGPKENFKPDRSQRDQHLHYTDHRGRPAEPHLEWDDLGISESFFGGEHTLILIICLSAIATMLVLILFIILAWMRRRSILAANRRGNHRMGPRGQGHLKNMFAESVPRALNIGSPSSWSDGRKMDENSTNEILAKRSSPVYWLKASTGSKGTLDGKNIHLQPVKSSGSDFSDDTLPPSVFREDPQQANNCLYATSPTRKVIYHNPTISGPAPVITCDNRGDTYLSIPSTSFSGDPTKYIVDFPVGSVYQSLIRSTPTPEQEIPQTRPIPLNSALYGTVCNSLPSSKALKFSTPKNEIGRRKPDTPGETHQPVSQPRRCKTIDRDTTLVVNNEAEDGMDAFPRLSKKSVEFASRGDEECLLVLPSDEDPHDSESLEAEHRQLQQQQQTGTFCHFPSSFV